MEVSRLKDKRICINCNQEPVESKNLCHRCYNRLVSNPRNNPKRITFKGTRKKIFNRLRKGRCEKCDKKIGDSYINKRHERIIIRKTDMHHYFYLIIMPWSCTIELCVDCHNKMKIGSR